MIQVPPAGVRVVFRVLRDDGEPVERLQSENFRVLNDETGRPFGSEGGGVPTLGRPTDFEFFTVLVLDMSDSIFANQAVSDVITGAEVFVRTMVEQQPPGMKQTVAIYAFGSTAESEMWVEFTQDHNILYSRLHDLRTAGSRGGTNLYGAYSRALETVWSQRENSAGLVTGSLVLLTDGTHEAGDTARMRTSTLRSLRRVGGGVDVYTIGIQGDYDEEAIRELASSPRNFYLVQEARLLADTFRAISVRILGGLRPADHRY